MVEFSRYFCRFVFQISARPRISLPGSSVSPAGRVLRPPRARPERATLPSGVRTTPTAAADENDRDTGRHRPRSARPAVRDARRAPELPTRGAGARSRRTALATRGDCTNGKIRVAIRTVIWTVAVLISVIFYLISTLCPSMGDESVYCKANAYVVVFSESGT